MCVAALKTTLPVTTDELIAADHLPKSWCKTVRLALFSAESWPSNLITCLINFSVSFINSVAV